MNTWYVFNVSLTTDLSTWREKLATAVRNTTEIERASNRLFLACRLRNLPSSWSNSTIGGYKQEGWKPFMVENILKSCKRNQLYANQPLKPAYRASSVCLLMFCWGIPLWQTLNTTRVTLSSWMSRKDATHWLQQVNWGWRMNSEYSILWMNNYH